MRGVRVVIPNVLIQTFLQLAHESHQGIVRTKQLLRERYWWPHMDKCMEEFVRQCHICQLADKSAKTTVPPFQPVQWPEQPWQQLGMDIIGPLRTAPNPTYAITLMDYHSKWPKLLFTNSITTQDVIKLLNAAFSREGLPETLVTDNGPQYTSREFQDFLKERGIVHHFSSNYYSTANGLIERFNRVLKEHIQVAELQRKDVIQTTTEFLGSYRITPHSTTGCSPAVLLHGRQPRSTLAISKHKLPVLPQASPSALREKVQQKQHNTKSYVDAPRAPNKLGLK